MFRTATISDKKQLIALWSAAFGDSREDIELFFSYCFEHCDCFVCEADGTIVSALYALHCKIVIDGSAANARYIYAAATDTRYRKMGYMSKLIEFAHESLSDIDYFLLIPASKSLEKFYSKLGYVTTFSHRKMHFPAEFQSKMQSDLNCDEYNITAIGDAAEIDDFTEIDDVAAITMRNELLASYSDSNFAPVIWDKTESYVNRFYTDCGYKWYSVGRGIALAKKKRETADIIEYIGNDADVAACAFCRYFDTNSARVIVPNASAFNRRCGSTICSEDIVYRGMLYTKNEVKLNCNATCYVNLFLE